MKLAVCELVSNRASPYSQSRYYKTPKLEKELPGDYETRTWRDRCHVNAQGNVIIPPMAFSNCIKEAARYLSLPIPGSARQTFTKHFESGVMVSEPLELPLKLADVQPEWLFVPSDGKRGGGRRVEKCFPKIMAWKGQVTFVILDDIITEDAFRQVIKVAGDLIGIGRFRPRNLGYYGRFECAKLDWMDR